MKYWKTRTPEQIAKAVAQLGNDEHYRYFFDRLENPRWIVPLRERKYFKQPPRSERDETSITFPPWPESAYLARVAPVADPQEVLDTILRMETTDNARVHLDVVEIALALPPDVAVKAVPRFKKFVSAGSFALVPEKLGQLVAHLATGGEVDASLDLFRSLLAVRSEKDQFGDEPSGRRRARAMFDEWHYGELLRKHVPVLADACGLRFLSLLCDLLDRALKISCAWRKGTTADDLSYIWRAAIEDHEQNYERMDVRDSLITAVRDAACRIVAAAPSRLPDVVTELEGRSFSVFSRLATYTVWRFAQSAPEMAHRWLAREDLFKEPILGHEYAVLLREQFAGAPQGFRAQLLAWIDDGPPVDETLDGVPADELERYQQRWRGRRLVLMGDSLPAQYEEQLSQLSAAGALPEHPEFISYHQSFSGPSSPRSVDELAALDVTSLVAYFKSWDPPDQIMGASREGLGRVFSGAVTKDPSKYAAEAGEFVGLMPAYVDALLSGLRIAARAGEPFEWQAVLSLSEWAIGQPDEVREGRRRGLEADWSWVRRSVAHLVAEGMRDTPATVPVRLHADVWRLLQRLMKDPSPTVADELSQRPNSVALDLAINSIRGVTVDAAIDYAFWVGRGDVPTERGLPQVVRKALERCIDPVVEETRAIRAVLGRAFPRLVHLDKAWAAQIAANLFSDDAQGRTAWKTYLLFSSAFDDVFEILRPRYEAAILTLGEPSADGNGDARKHLAQHLATYYWRGKLPGGPAEALGSFYSVASVELRQVILEYVGRALNQTEGDIAPAIHERIQALWEWRLGTVKTAGGGEEVASELTAFGWWLVSLKFPDEWATEQAVQVLRLGVKLRPEDMVMEHFERLAVDMPAQVVEAIRLTLDVDPQGWALLLWRESIRKILEVAVDVDDKAVRAEVSDLLDFLGKRGLTEFKNLYRPLRYTNDSE